MVPRCIGLGIGGALGMGREVCMVPCCIGVGGMGEGGLHGSPVHWAGHLGALGMDRESGDLCGPPVHWGHWDWAGGTGFASSSVYWDRVRDTGTMPISIPLNPKCIEVGVEGTLFLRAWCGTLGKRVNRLPGDGHGVWRGLTGYLLPYSTGGMVGVKLTGLAGVCGDVGILGPWVLGAGEPHLHGMLWEPQCAAGLMLMEVSAGPDHPLIP